MDHPTARRSRSVLVTGIAAVRSLGAGCCVIAALSAAGCGGEDEAKASADRANRAAATSLQQAMDNTARSIDGLRGTRSSLDRLGAGLQSSIDQTGDVIAALTPLADSPAKTDLLDAARSQRSFLQAARQSTASRSRSTGLGAVARARDAGRRASQSFASLSREQAALAGALPASTTFNVGRLRDAVIDATRPTKNRSASSANGGGGATAGSSCGGGVSVNSVTSCPFGVNVATEYSNSGGASTIEVYSPVTGSSYTMSCGGAMPVTCRGGNGAVVTIR